MSDIERKLASIQQVAEIKPIEGADRIVAYRIKGWWVVDSKDKYQVGDIVVYCEIDSWLPHEVAPFLSRDKEPREFGGIKGERLRTIKLKGQVSQGLLLHFDILSVEHDGNIGIGVWNEGDNVTDLLGIKKWEKPIPAQLRGMVRGNFPSEIPKTDQERCLSGDTIIETDIGKIKISDIVNNRLLCNALSFNASKDAVEYMPVIGYSVVESDSNWIELTLDNGTTLTCTEDHKIWSDTACGYVEAQQLSEGDTLMVIND